jgi:polyisoprenoid-binding protein YceI
MKRLLAVSAVLVASFAFAGWTPQGESSVTFKAAGNIGMKFVGVSKKAAIKDDGTNLVITAKLADLDTDNGLRNKHMLEDLEADKFPECSLTVPVASLKEGATDAEGKGTFAIHGKTHEVTFKYTSKCTAGVCDVEGSAELNLKDYDIKIRSYLGVTVKSEVSIGSKFQVKK